MWSIRCSDDSFPHWCAYVAQIDRSSILDLLWGFGFYGQSMQALRQFLGQCRVNHAMSLHCTLHIREQEIEVSPYLDTAPCPRMHRTRLAVKNLTFVIQVKPSSTLRRKHTRFSITPTLCFHCGMVPVLPRIVGDNQLRWLKLCVQLYSRNKISICKQIP